MNTNIQLQFDYNINNLESEKIKKEQVDWELYSKDILDSIKLTNNDENNSPLYLFEEKKGINPFLEEFNKETLKNLDYDNQENDDTDNSIKFPDIDNLDNSRLQSWDDYKLKELQKVAEYYKLSYKGKSKNKLIEKIIEFEEKEENCMKVYDREINWDMMNKLSKDTFFKKYIIN